MKLIFSACVFLLSSNVIAETIRYVRPHDQVVFTCDSDDQKPIRDRRCISKIVGILTPDFGTSQATDYAMRVCPDAVAGFSDCYVDAFNTFKPNYGASQALSMAERSCK